MQLRSRGCEVAVRVLSMVWDGYPGGGTELLALLALADWSDDNGRCWPSMASIARKTRLSEKQARRVVHSVIESGYLTVTDNAQGGATSRRYQINLKRLATPPAGGSPPTHGSPPADVPYPSHGWEATPPAGGSRTVIDTSITVKEVAQALPTSSAEKKSKKSDVTLKAFIEHCLTIGEKPIVEDDPIFAYAQKVGIDHEMLAVAWQEFKAAFLPTAKRQKDWRAHFRNAVRRNWYKLWFLRDGETAGWTTAGEQARRAAI